jgi:iron(III) transport system substrate-binding protein
MLATMVQLLGEDEAFAYLKALHANVSQYTKSGSAPIRAAATGETAIGIVFMHDAVAQAVEGAPIVTVAPCEGTGYEVGSMSLIKGGPNPDAAKAWYDWALSAKAQEIGARRKAFRCRRTGTPRRPPRPRNWPTSS